MKRRGILGGSYNPPHRGHSQVAESAMQELGLDEIWLWVSFNIFKDPSVYAPPDDRMAMTQLLVENKPGLKAIDMEKYFCDTMTATSLTLLQTMYPRDKFIWIFGDDNFASFHNWNRHKFKENGEAIPDWQYILNHFSVAVMHRPPFREAAQNSPAAAYGAPLYTAEPKELGTLGNGWTFLWNEGTPESSTHIKELLLSGERPIPGLPPAIEAYIDQRGLFQTHTDFNGAASPPASRNDVPFPVFLLLASTANLLKATALNNNCYDANALLAHAAASWDKSAHKGDFLNRADVPGEIADCLISLYWLAQPQGISLPGDGQETQQSVNEWCDTHYPDRPLRERLKDYMEELSELCVCAGMEKERMVNLLELVLKDPQADDMPTAYRKNYDLLQACAEESGAPLHEILDHKMTANRARSPEHSAARLAAKTILYERQSGEPRHEL